MSALRYGRGTFGDALLAVLIREIHALCPTHGARAVLGILRARGVRTSRKRVARLMRARDMRGTRERIKPVAPKVYAQRPVKRRTLPTAIDRVWAGDITYLDTSEGFLYLAVFIDLRSRYLVGWAVSDTQDTALALAALASGVKRRKPARGLHVHTDRGVQYSAQAFRAELDRLGFIPSMSRRGNCHDNAPVESFFASLKRELGRALADKPRALVRREVIAYLAGHYNTRRAHSTLGYLTPAAFEALPASEQDTILRASRARADKQSRARAAKRKLEREREQATPEAN
jgi:transposase InsO family protein